jgi:D-alanyl-D-alanine carboxypeptidase
VLLGLVILAATGDDWRAQVEARLLAPLGLADTELPDDTWGDIVTGYLAGIDQIDAIHPTAFGAAGCMTSTVLDQVAWGATVLGSDLLEEAEQEARIADPLPVGGPFSYGLGVLLWDHLGGVEIAHNGALPGYIAWTGYRPDEQATLALTSNSWVIDPDSGQYDHGWSVALSEALWEVVLGR